jgi:hypothetical protein
MAIVKRAVQVVSVGIIFCLVDIILGDSLVLDILPILMS